MPVLHASFSNQAHKCSLWGSCREGDRRKRAGTVGERTGASPVPTAPTHCPHMSLPLLRIKLAQELLIRFTTEIEAVKEIWATLAGATECFFTSPTCDISMMPGEQNVGHTPATELRWTRILWIF